MAYICNFPDMYYANQMVWIVQKQTFLALEDSIQ